MPTTDPVRRRRQNCENQKRWRERQTNQLHELQGTLAERDREVAELQKQLTAMRQDLRKAHDVSQSRRKKSGPKQYSPLSEVAAPPELKLQAAYHVPSVPVTGGMFTLLPAPVSDALCPDQHAKKAGVEHSLFDPMHANTEHVGYPYHAIQFGIDHNSADDLTPLANSLANSFFGQQPDAENFGFDQSPDFAIDQTNLDDSEEPIKLSEMLQEGMKRLPPQEELDQLPHDPRFLYADYTAHWMMGGNAGLAHMMTAFTDDSVLSNHISAVQMTIHRNLPGLRSHPLSFKENVVVEAFSWIIREAWPSSEGCFKMMAVYESIFSYELFRSFPCKRTYYRIHRFYRPTLLQLLVPHSPAIDWLPWPALRDKLILMQKNNNSGINIDELCMKALQYTLIEPDFPWPGQLHTFRIWDMYMLEMCEGGCFDNSFMEHYPASPTLQRLMRSRGLSLRKIEQLRIEEPFYRKFQDLLLPGCISNFQSEPIGIALNEKLQRPYPLRPEAVDQLREKIESMISGFL